MGPKENQRVNNRLRIKTRDSYQNTKENRLSSQIRFMSDLCPKTPLRIINDILKYILIRN